MKLSKRKVFVAAIAVCLIAILSIGSFAWFNANDDITNTFKVADSDDPDTKPDFSVDVWENDPTATDPNAKDDDGVTYEEIAPGDTIAKNPTIENTGDYDQWIRVYVTFTEFDVIKKACDDRGISADLRTWLNVDSNYWTAVDAESTSTADTYTYVYYYNYKLAEDQTAVLFTEVNIPGEFVQEDMDYGDDGFNITVQALAIQSDNNGTTAQEGFTKWSY